MNTGLIDFLLNILSWYTIGSWLGITLPVHAYDINMKIEQHAFETYTKYSAWHPEDTKIAEIAQDELNHAKELQHAMMMVC